MSRIDPARWIPVGVIGRPKGLQGMLWLRPFNDDIAALRVGLTVRVKREGLGEKTFVIASIHEAGKGLSVSFVGALSRDGAEALVLAEVAVRRGELAPLGDGEFYHCDLPGSVVHDASGAVVGEVVEVIAYPTVDSLLLRTPTGDRELPIAEGYVTSIDAEAGVVVLAEGAFDDEG